MDIDILQAKVFSYVLQGLAYETVQNNAMDAFVYYTVACKHSISIMKHRKSMENFEIQYPVDLWISPLMDRIEILKLRRKEAEGKEISTLDTPNNVPSSSRSENESTYPSVLLTLLQDTQTLATAYQESLLNPNNRFLKHSWYNSVPIYQNILRLMKELHHHGTSPPSSTNNESRPLAIAPDTVPGSLRSYQNYLYRYRKEIDLLSTEYGITNYAYGEAFTTIPITDDEATMTMKTGEKKGTNPTEDSDSIRILGTPNIRTALYNTQIKGLYSLAATVDTITTECHAHVSRLSSSSSSSSSSSESNTTLPSLLSQFRQVYNDLYHLTNRIVECAILLDTNNARRSKYLLKIISNYVTWKTREESTTGPSSISTPTKRNRPSPDQLSSPSDFFPANVVIDKTMMDTLRKNASFSSSSDPSLPNDTTPVQAMMQLGYIYEYGTVPSVSSSTVHSVTPSTNVSFHSTLHIPSNLAVSFLYFYRAAVNGNRYAQRIVAESFLPPFQRYDTHEFSYEGTFAIDRTDSLLYETGHYPYSRFRGIFDPVVSSHLRLYVEQCLYWQKICAEGYDTPDGNGTGTTTDGLPLSSSSSFGEDISIRYRQKTLFRLGIVYAALAFGYENFTRIFNYFYHYDEPLFSQPCFRRKVTEENLEDDAVNFRNHFAQTAQSLERYQHMEEILENPHFENEYSRSVYRETLNRMLPMTTPTTVTRTGPPAATETTNMDTATAASVSLVSPTDVHLSVHPISSIYRDNDTESIVDQVMDEVYLSSSVPSYTESAFRILQDPLLTEYVPALRVLGECCIRGLKDSQMDKRFTDTATLPKDTQELLHLRTQHTQEGVRYLQRAADKHDKASLWRLWIIYTHGIKVPRTTIELTTRNGNHRDNRPADDTDDTATVTLLEANTDLARTYFQKCLDNSLKYKALYAKYCLHGYEPYVSKDETKALHMYHAIVDGYPTLDSIHALINESAIDDTYHPVVYLVIALWNIGLCYIQGVGTRKNYDKGMVYINRIWEINHWSTENYANGKISTDAAQLSSVTLNCLQLLYLTLVIQQHNDSTSYFTQSMTIYRQYFRILERVTFRWLPTLTTVNTFSTIPVSSSSFRVGTLPLPNTTPVPAWLWLKISRIFVTLGEHLFKSFSFSNHQLLQGLRYQEQSLFFPSYSSLTSSSSIILNENTDEHWFTVGIRYLDTYQHSVATNTDLTAYVIQKSLVYMKQGLLYDYYGKLDIDSTYLTVFHDDDLFTIAKIYETGEKASSGIAKDLNEAIYWYSIVSRSIDRRFVRYFRYRLGLFYAYGNAIDITRLDDLVDYRNHRHHRKIRKIPPSVPLAYIPYSPTVSIENTTFCKIEPTAVSVDITDPRIREGTGILPHYGIAKEYFTEASDDDYGPALYELGKLSEFRVLDHLPHTYIQYYEYSILCRYYPASYNLGILYRYCGGARRSTEYSSSPGRSSTRSHSDNPFVSDSSSINNMYDALNYFRNGIDHHKHDTNCLYELAKYHLENSSTTNTASNVSSSESTSISTLVSATGIPPHPAKDRSLGIKYLKKAIKLGHKGAYQFALGNNLRVPSPSDKSSSGGCVIM